MTSNPHIHDWQKIVRELIEAGFTQQQLADKCGCAQSLISAMLNGNVQDVRSRIASPLLGLHRYHVKIKKG